MDKFIVGGLLICMILWSICFVLVQKIKGLHKAANRLIELNTAYEQCAKLNADYRVIRHDFANYVQAAGALEDEEGLRLVKQQKGCVRNLVKDWNESADAFMSAYLEGEYERDL